MSFKDSTIDQSLRIRALKFSTQWVLGPLMALLIISGCHHSKAQTRKIQKILSNKELQWLKTEGQQIKFAPNPNWPPGDFIEDSIHKGFVADYLALFEEMLGVKFIPVYYNSWTEMLQGIRSGQVDMIGAVHQTAERNNYLLFTDVYQTIPLGIVVSDNYTSKLTKDHINSMLLACTKDFASTEFIRMQYPNASIEEYDQEVTALTVASFGVTDGAVIDLMSASYLIDKYGITNMKLGTELDFNWQLRFGITNTKPELASIITKLLHAIPEKKRDEIYHTWVNRMEYQTSGFIKNNRNLLLLLGGGVVMAFTIILVFTWNLRRLVERRTRELTLARKEALGSEERYRLIVDNQTDLVIKVDAEGQFLFASPSYCSLFEVSAASLSKTTFGPLENGHTVLSLQQIEQALKQPPHQLTFTEKIQRSDSPEWISWVFSALSADFTKPVEIIAVGRNITPLMVQEQELREHADDLTLMHEINSAIREGKDLEEILDLLGNGIRKVYACTSAVTAVANAAKTHLFVRKISYPDNMAVKLEQLIRRKVADLSLRIPATGSGFFAQVMKTGKPLVIEGEKEVLKILAEFAQQRFLKPFISPVASLLNIHSIILLPLSSKNETLGVVEVARNRPFTENEIRRIERLAGLLSTIIDRWQADEALKASEEQYRTIFNSANDGITILKDHYFIHGNLKALEMFGVTSQEFIGSPPWNFSPPTQPNGKTSKAYAEEVMQSAFQGVPQRFEWIHKHLSNGDFFTEVTLNRFAIGDEVLIMAIIRDISDQKRTKEELIVAKEKAEESNRLKTHFLANMSHEIRTPMNGILGFLELLQGLNLSREKHDEYIALIRKSGHRLLETINDLIEMSKIEAGEVIMHHTSVDLTDLLTYLHRFLMPQATEKGLLLELRKPPDEYGLKIVTDKLKLESVLINLLRNAIKFTTKGHIEFGYIMENSTLKFYVKDTGPGIPESHLERIFDRFVQGDIRDTRGYEGSGLGLSIARAYTEQLGGKIWCESQVNEGTTFWFTIPWSSTVTPWPIETKPFENDEFSIPKTKQPLILIAEDDDISFLFLETILLPLGAQIIRSTTGFETVDAVRNHSNISLILMDLKMPEMNGLEASRQIRHLNPSLPIIAQTAYAMAGDREKALEAGCIGYITKPIKRQDLLEIILPCLPHDCSEHPYGKNS
jgi:PAS domain S-box-containing protein